MDSPWPESKNISSHINMRQQEYKKLLNRHLMFDLIKKGGKQWKSLLGSFYLRECRKELSHFLFPWFKAQSM